MMLNEIPDLVIKEFNLCNMPSDASVLYHYTSQAGLKGIIEDKQIWLTHIRCLNDTKEFDSMFHIARDIINSSISTIDSTVRNQIVGAFESFKNVNVCVCSFSKKRDDLSQWRAYSHGQVGYSIGFLGERIVELCKSEGFYFAKCVYDHKIQYEIIKRGIELLVENYANEPLDFISYLKHLLCALGPICKDPSFHDEEEYRIITPAIACTTDNFAYRHGKSSLIPYLKFDLGKDNIPKNIREIIVGPTREQNTAIFVTESLAIKHWEGSRPNRTDSFTKGSKIPFRNWH